MLGERRDLSLNNQFSTFSKPDNLQAEYGTQFPDSINHLSVCDETIGFFSAQFLEPIGH